MKWPVYKKKPLTWFFLLPFIVVPFLSLFISFEPSALEKKLTRQNVLEVQLRHLEQEISNSVLSYDDQEKINHLQERKKLVIQELSHYKSKSRKDMPEAYVSFYILVYIAILFLAWAITWYRDIPLFLRYGCMSTGTILSGIVILQLIVAAMMVPTSSAFFFCSIFACICIIGTIFCWWYFIKNVLKR